MAHPDLRTQIKTVDQRLQSEPVDVAALIQRGDLRRREQDFVGAAEDFAAARAADPDHPELDFHEGRLALEAGDAHSAEDYLSRYLEHQPEQPVAWRLLGEAHFSQGDVQAAANCLGRAISLSDTPSPALFRQQVVALEQAGESEQSLAVVDEGLAIFGPEINLLGLGADIALAAGQTRRSREYLDHLPSGLQQLPQWQARIAAVQETGESVK